jgi:hypothetical protein
VSAFHDNTLSPMLFRAEGERGSSDKCLHLPQSSVTSVTRPCRPRRGGRLVPPCSSVCHRHFNSTPSSISGQV